MLKNTTIRDYKKSFPKDSFQFRRDLKKYLEENGHRKNPTNTEFRDGELEEITGFARQWWRNWKLQEYIPAHILLHLHVNFNLDLKTFLATGELKKILREELKNGKLSA